jgi:hypothetical protein
MARRPPGVSTSARWLAGVLVAVLAIGAIVLSVIAIDRVRSPQASAEPAPAPTFSFGGAATTEPTPSSTPAPVSAPTYPQAEERFLSIGSGGMWRGVAGECGAADPLIERSADGGRTWENVTPGYRGIGQVVSLDAFAGTEAETVARMGADCETQALRTFTQGEFWEPYPEVLAASRYLDPTAPNRLITPNGAIDAPCADPRSARAAGTTVALLCEGTAYALGSNGEWLPLPTPDAVAVAIAGNQLLIAARSTTCQGLEVSTLSGSGFSESAPLGCAAVDPAAPVAVASFDNGALLWSGDSITPLGR